MFVEKDVLDAFGITVPVPAAAPAPTDPAPAPEPVTEPVTNPSGVTDPAPQNQNGGEPVGGEPAPQPNPTNTQTPEPSAANFPQQNTAWAEMRTQNKQLKNALTDVAKLLGVQDTDTTAILDAVKNATIAAQAKQQNISPDLLRELTDLKQKVEATDAQNLANAAKAGFEALKTEFNLDNNALTDFVKTLAQDRINPFEKAVNLKQEYITRNYPKLIEAAIAKGVAQEIERRNKVQNNSTAPNPVTGAGGAGAGTKTINSVSALDNFLASLTQQK